ncbi:DNA cytosine methyltransferase [Shewanella baltica]|uniref:DNA (cytosine-5-)-methyltransferase n=1 Tax=Shewanella oncorhynchi TaxID=2726434 RepID=A0ABX1KT12_9GAMM|nr:MULTISPECIES: DNA cytosine methyltransferase [Shewanella]MCS6236172.1 DNA cytosine methyltransferase [Shewanella baltica]MCS6270715.1 DNA cytosine methyltransferase [Shewanella baltica]NLQ24513.1 DNA cytosine methyltransferase [Shewanella oncorhynchi]SUI79481.1 Modification methylase BanI [Shewanella baltica]
MNSNVCDNQWLRCFEPPNYNQFVHSINIVDLFAGCGGLTLGALEAAKKHGLSSNIKLAVELNTQAANTYESNFYKSLSAIHKGDISELISNYPGDIVSATEREIQLNNSNIDVLLAGPPCQGHSRLNNHTRSKDPRNKLYLKVIRFVELCRPKFVVIENVLNIKYDSDNILQESANFLTKLGYTVENLIIKTVSFGIAQNRVRHIQVASIEKIDFNLDAYRSSSVLSDVIEDIIDNGENSDSIFDTPSVTAHSERIDYLFDHELYDLPNEMRPDCHKNKKHTYKTSYGRLKWDQPSSTITRGFSTMGQGRFVHPLRRRTLTPHEAARIQGFPDFFSFKDYKTRGNLHLMIANAVPPKISAMLVDLYLSQSKRN